MNEVHLDRALSEEFADKIADIHALKVANPAFKDLLHRNHRLWLEIQKIQEDLTPTDDAVLEELEKQRLAILDEISTRLQSHISTMFRLESNEADPAKRLLGELTHYRDR